MAFDYRDSLLRRLRAVHSLYYDACATMDLEQVNRVVHENTLPIAFSLVHQVLIEDGALWVTGGPLPQFNDEWAARIGLAIADHGQKKTVDEMMHQKIENYEAFLEFQRLVFDATENYIAGVDPETWSDIVIAVPYGFQVASTFSARVGGDKGISRSDAMECWVYQHALRHMGEIEHARALVGLGGMTS